MNLRAITSMWTVSGLPVYFGRKALVFRASHFINFSLIGGIIWKMGVRTTKPIRGMWDSCTSLVNCACEFFLPLRDFMSQRPTFFVPGIFFALAVAASVESSRPCRYLASPDRSAIEWISRRTFINDVWLTLSQQNVLN
jgi:hypothetical protein